MQDILWLGHHYSIKSPEPLEKQIVTSIEKKKKTLPNDSGMVSTEVTLNTTGVKTK